MKQKSKVKNPRDRLTTKNDGDEELIQELLLEANTVKFSTISTGEYKLEEVLKRNDDEVVQVFSSVIISSFVNGPHPPQVYSAGLLERRFLLRCWRERRRFLVF